MTTASLKRLFIPPLAAVVIGPLVWGILVVVFLGTMILRDAGTTAFIDPEIAKGFAVTAPIYIGASYYFGAPIALIAGLLVGAIWISGHPPTLLIAIAAALVATVVWQLGNWWFTSSFYPVTWAMFGAAAVLGAISCWFILRRYVSRL